MKRRPISVWRALLWKFTLPLLFLLYPLSGQEPPQPDGGEASPPEEGRTISEEDYFAEPGTIAGSVIDTALGTAVSGALVKVEDTTYIAVSDISGNFTIQDVTPGEYTITIEQGNYQATRVEGVVVESGEVARLDLGLSTATESLAELEAFVVTFEDVQTSGMKLLGDRQKSVTLSDAIGEEAFSRLGVGDAAEAMTKVTGASVVDGKYLLVRGLGDRYSNTLLNGATLPSADPDRRAVQMDQFPADVLESIVTSKSFTPDQPGNFSGGSVNMRTKSFPDQYFLKLGVSVGYNTEATFKDGLSIPGGDTDWLGFDDGTREQPALPESGLPNATVAVIQAQQGNFEPAEELDRIIRSFNNEVYFPAEKEIGPNYGFSFSMGDQIQLQDEAAIGYILSLTYDSSVSNVVGGTTARHNQGNSDINSENFIQSLRIYSPNPEDYTFFPSQEANFGNLPFGTDNFGVYSTTWSVNWGFFSQFAYKPNSRNEFSMRFLYNQSADDRIRRGGGENQRSESGRYFEAYDMLYTERSIANFQVDGKHMLSSDNDIELNWRLSVGESTQEQPDFRTFDYFYDFNLDIFAQASGGGNSRYFRDLAEENLDVAFDLKIPFDFQERTGSYFKVGASYVDGSRTYRENIYRWSASISSLNILTNYPQPVGIVDRGPNFVNFGNTLTDQSIGLVNYDATREVLAGYAMVDIGLRENFRLIGGLRYEDTNFQTESPEQVGGFEPGLIQQDDLLPAISAVYTLNEEMNIRAAYGKTLARPQYRELAAITIVTPFLQQTYTGNADIEMSSIDNFDLRWEWFPRAGEIVAVSAFYKDLEKPIEVAEQTVQGRTTISPQNVDSGKVYGIEFEYRQSLDVFSEILKDFTLGMNFALIESEVGIPEEELQIIRNVIPDAPDTRELIEQSPYTFNFDITWSKFDWGTTATVAYNVVGDRLSLVTNGARPDIEERSYPKLDFIFSQELSKHWTMKFSVKNILGETREKSFDDFIGNRYFYSLEEPGTSFSLGFGYEFY